MTRILYCCDVHGSKLVWKKFIRVIPYYKVDIAMMCGDLTGKAIVPIVKQGASEWFYSFIGRKEILRSPTELERAMESIREQGFYPYETDPKEVEDLKNNPKKLNELFIKLMKDTLKDWLVMLEKVPKNIRIFVNPGNDDSFAIDEILDKDERVINPLNKVVNIDQDFEMISCEYVNPTPWNTPRECSEEKLKEKLENEFNKVSNYERTVCNFHCPPFDTHLDIAPKLDENLRPIVRFGSPVRVHVGSTAVRKSIEEYQPFLCLHGHIHESDGYQYIRKTLCLNPGSDYLSGILCGYVLDLIAEGKKVKFWRIEV